MEKEPGYLDELAEWYSVFISDFRTNPQLRSVALVQMKCQFVPTHRQEDWQRAIDYLTEGSEITHEN